MGEGFTELHCTMQMVKKWNEKNENEKNENEKNDSVLDILV